MQSAFVLAGADSLCCPRQISPTTNIHTHGFLSKCKNDLILQMDQSKSRKKNDKNIELELYNCKGQHTRVWY